jgi:hypothetical protein
MKKQHIIIIAVIIAAWAAFMGYRHMQGKRDVEEHRAAEYGRIIETAKLSPRAGLAQMGTALKRYHEEKNAYPASLNELYPKHVASKAFIDEIDWYYEPRGDNFFLSKTVIRDNKRMIASVDRELNPRMETGVMVAAPTPTPEPAVTEKPEAPVVQVPGISIQSREEFWEALRRRQMGVTAEAAAERRKASVLLLARRPEIISVDESEVISEAESELSQRYLVWKDSRGVLGISDAQLPVTERQTIYAEGNWYDIKVPLPEDTGSLTSETAPVETQVDPAVVASNMSERYLVWKGEQGTLGFGNIEYPEKDRVSVFQTDGWVNIEMPVPPAESAAEGEKTIPEPKTPDTIASHLSTEYLVWKDQQTLGFGNVGYPAKDGVSAYQDDAWVGAQGPVPPVKTVVQEDSGSQEGKSPETIMPELGTRYLVWKDEQGNLGFGNIGYPTKEAVSAYQDDAWVGIQRPVVPGKTVTEEDDRAQEGKSTETITSELDTRYLIWKDEQGNLGFGNVKYPEAKNISHVHVNGTWEKVVN